MVRRRFLRPAAVLLGAVCLINGCHQWRQEHVSAQPLNERHLSSARVRMRDGRQMLILEPRVVGDSLVGHIDSEEPGPASLRRLSVLVPVSVALAGVSTVESRHLNVWKTAGATVLVVVGILVGGAIVYGATCSPSDFFCGRR